MEQLRLTIERMSFGPYGVGHHGDSTVLVPAVTPGDMIDAAIVARRRGHAIGEMVRVIESGPDRCAPPCSFVLQCGGCDWQHIAYPAQVRFKAELLAAEFRRALGIYLSTTDLIEPAPDQFGYRGRVRLSVGPDGQLGYRRHRSHDLVAIDRCLVACGEIEVAQGLARKLRRQSREIEIAFANERYILIASLGRAPTDREIALARRVIEADGRIAGIVLRSENARAVVGDVGLTIEAEPGCPITAAADNFSQVNHRQNAKLVATVMEFAALRSGTPVLDLYCGAGNFSLPAAHRGAIVTGVDADSSAIADARANAARMQLEVNFVAETAQGAINFLRRAKYRPELVILDPPRTGAAALIESLAMLRPARIIYVSCDLSTMMRDLARLKAHDYIVARVKGFDFFPQTHHLEAAAELLLT
jgi:23S rRNA (uracil1939-C5)-methyltransferase